MTSPFDDEDGSFCVLVNDEGQHSLWPTFKDVPAGWTTVGPVGARKECLLYVEGHWTDLRPKSLARQMGQSVLAASAEADKTRRAQ
jgi:MbtH protein